MHCWALGGAYGSMPVADVRLVLAEFAGYCRERDLSFTAYPMHEVLAHPAAPEVLRLFAPYLGEDYDPMLTPGAPLAVRSDWKAVVAAARACGARSLWVAFHGFGEEHDRQLRRDGAFAETCLAVRRTQESGLGTGANVFLTKTGLVNFDRLLAVLRDLKLGKLSFELARYTPTARGRQYEGLRPDLSDLAQLADEITEISDLDREFWGDLGSFTEAAWVRRALNEETAAPFDEEQPEQRVVCRPNLDIYTGDTGIYHTRHGNLRRDDARQVIQRALDAAPLRREAIYFPNGGPATAELASQFGDPSGTKIYRDHRELRYRWLDQAEKR
jgi:hypothetical protein